MKKYITIATTISSKASKEKIIKNILDKQLSPCIQTIKGIESSYIWKNQIKNDFEDLILIKTNNKNKNFVIKEIEDNHPYDIPEIICYNFNILSNKYEKWFSDNIAKK
tara:strand:+ start:3615 stop:3938 length:324 start_codon:yes stop_codon:yes gene_type:complete